MAELSLIQKQKLFAKLLALLIIWIYAQGWELTLGEGYRADGNGHMPGSLHYAKLAQDLNLFVKGQFMTKDCPEWQAIGKKWLSMNPLCAWGGTFTSVDLNHVSIKEGGKE